MHRILCTLLLLAVLASQALGAVHAATHVGADAGECVLCASYVNPSAALPNNDQFALRVSNHRLSGDFLLLAEPTSAVACVHQRGPPPRI